MAEWTRSLAGPDLVRGLLRERYGLAAPRVDLVRSFVNDVYRVTTGADVLALKIYGVGRWSSDEVRWEQALAAHLVDSGLVTAAPVALLDGDTAGELAAPEGPRPFALTRWVPGTKPQPSWTDSLYHRFGAELARFHAAADTFATDLPRRRALTGREADEIVRVWRSTPELSVRPDSADVHRLVTVCAERASAELHRAVDDGLRTGIEHGDASLDNLHVNGDTISLYDLDLAGPGWPVADLWGGLETDHAEAYLAGYQTVRPLSEFELATLPWLRMLNVIANLRFHVVVKPRTAGTVSLNEGWVQESIELLAALAGNAGVAV